MSKLLHILLPLLCLALLSCGAKHTSVDCPECNDSVLALYEGDATVHQLLIVQHTGGSTAAASFYVKVDGCWQLHRTGDAFIGRNGVGKQMEGDGKTPLGEFAIGTAFGILPDPGTAIPYVLATPSLYGCEGPDAYYNQLIDTAAVHAEGVWGEHIIDYAPDYHYALTTSYNAACTPGLGSNIYIHCKGKKPHTAGCVALDEDFMKHILLRSDTGLIISIRP